MAAVFGKLNVKGHDEIVVLNAPQSFGSELNSLKDVVVHRSAAKLKKISFILAFVTNETDLEKTSKKYQSTIDRDSGWDALSAVGFRGVAMIAIDDDWSAKRVRRFEYVKPETRGRKARVFRV